MFPLKKRIIGGYTFGQKTWYTSRHLGVDYKAKYDNLYAPFDGVVVKKWGPQGGNTIWFNPVGQPVIIRFMHLSKILKTGKVKEGELIAVTGNTGLSRGAHLHLDISKGTVQITNFPNFIDPEKFVWDVNKPADIVDIPTGTPTNLVDKVALAIQKFEGWYPPGKNYPRGSVSYRQNNPGNMIFTDYTKSLGALRKGDRFAIFPDYETGFKALKQFITDAAKGELKSYNPSMTILEFFGKYTGQSTNMNYASFIAREIGKDINMRIKDLL